MVDNETPVIPFEKTITDYSVPADGLLHPQGMSRASEILPLLPFGSTTLWKWSKDGNFPAPVKVGNNITAWRNKDVIDWLNSQTPATSSNDEAEV